MEAFDEGIHSLKPGDVVMVRRQMRDKATQKPFTWRFFMVLVYENDDDVIEGYVVGNERLKDQPLTIRADDGRNLVDVLDQSEWPDGVHAFRLSMILRGLIPEIV
jgi:hypothetical protein